MDWKLLSLAGWGLDWVDSLLVGWFDRLEGLEAKEVGDVTTVIICK